MGTQIEIPMEIQILSVIDNLYKIQCDSTGRNFKQNTATFIDELKKSKPELSKKYSAIYAMFENNKMTSQGIERIKYMLSKAAEVKSGGMTQHDASVAVGQVLVDEIVKPQLKT